MDDEQTPLEAHQQFAADINTVWASWHLGRLSEEDAMIAIREHLDALRDGTQN